MSASKSRPRWQSLPPAVRTAVERLVGAPVVDARSCPGGFSPGFASRLITVLSSVAADGIDPEPIVRRHVPYSLVPAPMIDAILAAHAGFLLRGGLAVAPARAAGGRSAAAESAVERPRPAASSGLAPIAAAKLRLGLGAARWLRRRLMGVP